MTPNSDRHLPFTGERFTPECVREIWYEHLHRYAFAAPLARGRRVLDAACGEGFGAAMLAASGALSVLGVDIDPQAVAHATQRYASRPGIRFEVADAARLDSVPDASIDLVCSFETLEHLAEHDELLAGFARVLADGGLLLISTPDKHTYTDLTGQRNPYHVRELYRNEFEALLARHFPQTRLWGQKLLFQSVIWSPDRRDAWDAHTEGGSSSGLSHAPVYWLALCAKQAGELDVLPSLHLFGDAAESVYRHYDEEIRKGIRAGERIAELEAELARLRAAVGPTAKGAE